MMAEVSAAGSAVSVSTAEAKSEKIINALNKIKKKKRKAITKLVFFPFPSLHLTYSY